MRIEKLDCETIACSIIALHRTLISYYQALLSDTEFLNLVAYRLQTVRESHTNAFQAAISEVGALIEAIEVELGG